MFGLTVNENYRSGNKKKAKPESEVLLFCMARADPNVRQFSKTVEE
jgi:hypothetical protein